MELREDGVLPECHQAVARGEPSCSVAERLQRTQAEGLRYGPGQGWGSSHIGYLQIRRLIEDVSAGSLGDALHALVLGPLSSAALLSHRLMTGRLLPQSLLGEMLRPFVLAGPIPGRPWTSPGYGLGLMVGLCDGRPVAGRTGGGPGSVIAVYRETEGTGSRTVAAFSGGEDAAIVECAALESLRRLD